MRPRILITGSARLSVFKKGGDSLAGRHFNYRLHPFSVGELMHQMAPSQILEKLLSVGGFPEPFINGSQDFAKRWRSTHLDRILKEDLLELQNVRNIKLIEVLVDLLADRVGSTVSFNSLARDLEISPHTVKNWISILESLYIIFVVTPYSRNIGRALIKEPKIYFYDTGRINQNLAARLENVVACGLQKTLNFRQDTLGERSQLHYIRDRQKREVDFATVIDNQINTLVEVKTSDSKVSQSLKYFHGLLKPHRTVQAVYHLNRKLRESDIEILPLVDWLQEME